MPSSVPLWAGGFAAELRDDAEGIAASCRRLSKSPLGSAAGYGVPGLPIDREATRRTLGFDVVHEPVTAVQISGARARPASSSSLPCSPRTWADGGRSFAVLHAGVRFIALPDTIPRARRSCPRSGTPTCSSWCGVPGRRCSGTGGNPRTTRQARLRLPARPPADEIPPVPRYRPGWGHGPRDGPSDPRSEVPAGEHPPRRFNPCSRAGQRTGAEGRHQLPGSLQRVGTALATRKPG